MTWTTFQISKIIQEGLDKDIKKIFNMAESLTQYG